MLSFYLSACALLAAFFAAGVMLGRGGAKKDYSLGGRKAAPFSAGKQEIMKKLWPRAGRHTA